MRSGRSFRVAVAFLVTAPTVGLTALAGPGYAVAFVAGFGWLSALAFMEGGS